METFVTVAVIVGVLVLAVLLIRLLDAQHGRRTTAFHYSHSGLPLPGPDAAHRRGRFPLRRRTRHPAGGTR